MRMSGRRTGVINGTRFKRSAFEITETELKLIAAARNHRRQQPAGNGIQNALPRVARRARYRPARNVRFLLSILATVASDNARATAIPRKSPLTSVTWPLFHRDIRAPFPMAIRYQPAPARARRLIAVAGHCKPRARRAAVSQSARVCSAGRTSHALHRCRVRCPTALRGGKPVTRRIITRMPASCSALSASCVVSLMGSETASKPARR